MEAIKPKMKCLFIALIVLTLARSGFSAATAKLNMSVITQQDVTGATNMEVTTPDLGPAQLKTLPSGGAVVQLGKLPQGGEPGDPMLPYSLVRLLVPPDADLTKVKVKLSSGTWEELSGEYEIAPAPPAAHTAGDGPVISWGAKNESIIVNGRDSTIYGADAYFPAEPVQIVSVGQFRQWKLVEFKIWMAAYNPVKKKVRILKDTAATLSVDKLPANLAVGLNSATPPALPGAAKFASQVSAEVDNPQDLEVLYGSGEGAGSSSEGAPGLVAADYVIITTNTIVTNSTKLASFILDKQAQGYTVKTVTEAVAADDLHYITGASCNARADNIRSWLQNHYLGDGTDYVLLIGNPHPDTFSATTSIPMKWTWPRSASTSDRSAPSDMYFAELSNTWDLDTDGMYGEFNGDYGAGGCDKFCEVKLGRIPFYTSYTDLDSILQKCIDYRTASGDLSWRSKVLIPAAVSNWQPQDDSPYNGTDDYPWGDTFGDNWGQAIKLNASGVGFSSYTLYEKSGCYAGGSAYPLTACNAPITKANVKAEWPNKYGFVTWWGHGNSTGAYRRTWNSDNYGGGADNWTQHPYETSDTAFFQSADCAALDDNYPSFTVQVSCNNGWPEVSTNLGYSLLKRGAVGTISGTRVTWYAIGSWTTALGASVGDNASYGYYMFDEMGVNSNDVGTALVNCKSSFGTGWASGSSWMNMVDLSLYGDPSLLLSTGVSPVKWEQPPDETYNGIDIRCDRDDGFNRVLADDFNCTRTGPITNVTFWGSWRSDDKGTIQKIHLSIHSDDPIGPGGSDPQNEYSKPDILLWERDFYAADFNETLYKYDEPEWFWDPTAGDPPPTESEHYGIWQYDISIDDSNQFVQQGDPCNPIIYWLDIWVELDQNIPGTQFGWKTSSVHWNDDAVFQDTAGMWQELRYPPGHPYNPDSIDMSFKIITSEQEPNNIKWLQEPDLTYNGVDIRVDRCDGIPRIIADDFLCTTTGLITDVHLWGSWKYDQKGNITKIHLSIHSDDPIGPGGTEPDNQYSKPDILLWEMDFEPTEFVESLYYTLEEEYEWWWDVQNSIYFPTGDQKVWKYDIDIDPAQAFRQEGSEQAPIIYWLDVYVETDGGPEETDPGKFGWKTRRWPEHYQDDAVIAPPNNWQELRYPTGHDYEGDSIDMAFAITTEVNEPNEVGKPLEPHTKWSQPPVEIDPASDVPRYCGWDEESYGPPGITWHLVADDFRCLGTMPVTSIHWWGSYTGWEWSQNHGTLPPILPSRWWIGFWSNVPAGAPPEYLDYSYPEVLLHSITIPANRVTSEEVGSDEYYGEYPLDICYQYNVDLEPEEVFWQDDYNNMTEDNIYWISIVAEYDVVDILYPWGWKTRPWHWMDDAVKFSLNGEPAAGHTLSSSEVVPIKDNVWQESMDVSFELDTDPNYIKWEQLYTGIRHWPHYEDVNSIFNIETPENELLAADDWRCLRRTPVTALSWWGSYIGYGYEACSLGPFMPLPVSPDKFRLKMWTDVPAGQAATVAAGSDNGYVYVYDGLGNLLWSYDTGHDVASVDVSVDGKYIAVGSYQNKLYLFDRSGNLLWQKDALIEYSYGTGWMGEESKSVSMSAYGEYVVAACSDGLFVYNNDGTLHWSDSNKETCADISPNGNYIAACDESSGLLSFFSITSSTALWTVNINAYWVATSNPGYVAASDGSSVYLFDNAGTQIWNYSMKSDHIRVDMPEDGLSVVAANDDSSDSHGCELNYFNDLNDGTAGWSAADGTPVWTYDPGGSTSDFYSVAISGDGNYITTGPAGGSYVFSKSSNTPVQTLSMGTANAYDLTYNGQYGACGNRGGELYYFSKDSNTPLWNKTLGGIVHTVAVGLGSSFSHPGEIIWQYETSKYDEVLVGYDKHPHGEPNEPVFRYSVRLPEDEWFKQKDVNGIYWLSIQAVYDINIPNYDWGWTNHEHVFNDDAVIGHQNAASEWVWKELYDQTEASEDMSFILFTDPNECVSCADYNKDGIVNLIDYADFANDWLWTGPAGGYNNSDLNCDGSVDFYDLKILTDQWLNSCP